MRECRKLGCGDVFKKVESFLYGDNPLFRKGRQALWYFGGMNNYFDKTDEVNT
jgi:hypothetical protein